MRGGIAGSSRRTSRMWRSKFVPSPAQIPQSALIQRRNVSVELVASSVTGRERLDVCKSLSILIDVSFKVLAFPQSPWHWPLNIDAVEVHAVALEIFESHAGYRYRSPAGIDNSHESYRLARMVSIRCFLVSLKANLNLHSIAKIIAYLNYCANSRNDRCVPGYCVGGYREYEMPFEHTAHVFSRNFSRSRDRLLRPEKLVIAAASL